MEQESGLQLSGCEVEGSVCSALSLTEVLLQAQAKWCKLLGMFFGLKKKQNKKYFIYIFIYSQYSPKTRIILES